MRKSVSDLGMAAYLMLHGYKPACRKGRTVCFELDETKDIEEFDKLSLEYLQTDFRMFDSHLMSLKSVGETTNINNDNYMEINDLGVAAYLMLKGHKVLGRRGKNIIFHVAKDDKIKLKKTIIEYICSSMHQFDSYLIALKKMPDGII